MPDPIYLLDDRKMQEFIANGFTTIKVNLPPEFHEEIYRKTDEVFEKEGNPGNNVLPRVPEIQTVFDQPEVRGAFTSILGPGYTMHTHRHCHFNKPNGPGGGWHKDSYWGYYKLRYHRNRWAMAFYYPQDVELINGPTGVIPHTHCYMDRLKNPDEAGVSVCGEAGTIAIVHFDIWHRAMPNQVDTRRYMMKFQFTRMSEPRRPEWNHNDEAWSNTDVGNRHPFVWNSIWEWSRGLNANGHVGNVDALTRTLQEADEPARLNAAYELAATGEPAVGPLARALQSADDSVKLNAAYALAAVGEPAVSELAGALKHKDEKVRGHAAFALGDAGPAAAEAVSALANTMDDPSEWVRHHAAEALGTIAGNPDEAVPALAKALKDDDVQVRYNSAYSLARFGADAEPAIPALHEALQDENRYASGHAAVALQYIGTPESLNVLLDHLSTARWCPITTREDLY